MKRALGVIAIGVLGFVGACGGGGTGGSGASGGGTSSSSSGTGGGSSSGIACDGQPADLSLTGTWAVFGDLSITFQSNPGGAITLCPTDQIGQATLMMLVSITQSTTDPLVIDSVKATLCTVDLPTVSALVGQCDPMSQSLVTVDLETPPALLAAFPKVASATVGGSLGGKTPGSSIGIERFVVTVGSDKTGAALPKWNASAPGCNDPNVGRTTMCEATCVDDCADVSMRDDDLDGFPGVTIEVCGLTPSDQQSGVPCNASDPTNPGATLQGRAFMDIEVDPLCTGVAKSSCELVGTVDTGVRYNLVGADVFLAGAPISVSAAIGSLPAFQVVPAESNFRMVRIDGQYGAPDFMVDPTDGSASCATILARANEIF